VRPAASTGHFAEAAGLGVTATDGAAGADIFAAIVSTAAGATVACESFTAGIAIPGMDVGAAVVGADAGFEGGWGVVCERAAMATTATPSTPSERAAREARVGRSKRLLMYPSGDVEGAERQTNDGLLE
jgi:hypothetical protein